MGVCDFVLCVCVCASACMHACRGVMAPAHSTFTAISTRNRICGAQCKIKMRSPLLKNYEKLQEVTSIIKPSVGILSTKP